MIARVWWRLVRFGFRLLYNEFAFTYDLVSNVVSLGAWRCWQRAALQYLNCDGRILELAHGTGNLQIDLADANIRAIGYDLSPTMGHIARRKLQKRNLAAPLARGMAQALPFPDKQFSSVISTFPSEFIVAPETLAEVRRVLQPDGVFVIVPGASFTGGGLAKTVLDWLYHITGQTHSNGTVEHTQFEDWLSPHGFEVRVNEVRCPRSVVIVIVGKKS